MLLHDQKLEKILELLKAQPYWTTKDLAIKLGTSRSTAQKCLQELHNVGLIERIHGGARYKNVILNTPVSVDKRLGEDFPAKQRICAEAFRILPKNGYVYLDAGTTILPLAQKISENNTDKNLIVVTNDVSIAVALAKYQVQHILLGGHIHPVTQSISGTETMNQLSRYHFDACFISADSISPEGCVNAVITEEAHLKYSAITRSNSKILMAASSKFFSSSGTAIAELKDFNIWVTDKTTPAMAKLCSSTGIDLIKA
ncbi:MAG: DeoR/GlpR family DNA-binding transcription regulator [Phycisphaerae bacterium]|jgi:DeoR family fructose operon transcriptional repressor